MASKLSKSSSWPWRGLVLLGLLFLGSIGWSIWFDTLAPLVREGDYQALVFNLVGIPIILAGTAVIVYGGYLIVSRTFTLFEDEAFMQTVARIRQRPSSGERRQVWAVQFAYYRRAWAAGAAWILAGFALMAVGGYLINR
jgi:hypothetical protein